MRQRSPLCVRSVQEPLWPSRGAACRSRSAVASATTASRSAPPSPFQRGQSTAYISWRTYQPSRVTGAALTGSTIARARGPVKGTSQAAASALERAGMPSAPPDRRAAAAAGLLRRVFASLEAPLTFRLWDGTTARVGTAGESGCAVVFRSRGAFRRIVRRPTSLRFGEAYIDGELDIEGDIFAAMRAASAIERLRVPLGVRLAV